MPDEVLRKLSTVVRKCKFTLAVKLSVEKRENKVCGGGWGKWGGGQSGKEEGFPLARHIQTEQSSQV